MVVGKDKVTVTMLIYLPKYRLSVVALLALMLVLIWGVWWVLMLRNNNKSSSTA